MQYKKIILISCVIILHNQTGFNPTKRTGQPTGQPTGQIIIGPSSFTPTGVQAFTQDQPDTVHQATSTQVSEFGSRLEEISKEKDKIEEICEGILKELQNISVKDAKDQAIHTQLMNMLSPMSEELKDRAMFRTRDSNEDERKALAKVAGGIVETPDMYNNMKPEHRNIVKEILMRYAFKDNLQAQYQHGEFLKDCWAKVGALRQIIFEEDEKNYNKVPQFIADIFHHIAIAEQAEMYWWKDYQETITLSFIYWVAIAFSKDELNYWGVIGKRKSLHHKMLIAVSTAFSYKMVTDIFMQNRDLFLKLLGSDGKIVLKMIDEIKDAMANESKNDGQDFRVAMEALLILVTNTDATEDWPENVKDELIKLIIEKTDDHADLGRTFDTGAEIKKVGQRSFDILKEAQKIALERYSRLALKVEDTRELRKDSEALQKMYRKKGITEKTIESYNLVLKIRKLVARLSKLGSLTGNAINTLGG